MSNISDNSLFEILNAKPQASIFSFNDRIVSWQDFYDYTRQVALKIQESKINNWCLYCNDTFLFATGLFALLGLKKKVIIAPNIQSGTIERLSLVVGGIITDEDLSDNGFVQVKLDGVFSPNKIPSNYLKIDLGSKISFFTSGSSGDPKEVEKTLDQLMHEVITLDKTFGNECEKDDLFLSTVSHQHIYGFLFRLFWPLYRGNIIMSSLITNIEELYKESKTNTVTLISSPAFLKRLSKDLSFDGQLQLILSSGGLLQESEAREVFKIFGKYPTEIFGSTETGGVAWRSQDKDKLWEVLLEVKIKTRDDGQLQVMSPYANKDNYFNMSDCAEIISKNKFILKARTDRIVKIEEKRVSLVEIENKLLDSDFVDECCATAITDIRQVICIAAKLSANGRVFLEENGKLELNKKLRKYLLQYFEPITLPRRWRYLDEIERNTQGKVLKCNIDKLFNKLDV